MYGIQSTIYTVDAWDYDFWSWESIFWRNVDLFFKGAPRRKTNRRLLSPRPHDSIHNVFRSCTRKHYFSTGCQLSIKNRWKSFLGFVKAGLDHLVNQNRSAISPTGVEILMWPKRASLACRNFVLTILGEPSWRSSMKYSDLEVVKIVRYPSWTWPMLAPKNVFSK